MVTLFEGLQSRHEIVTASNAGGDDALGDTGCDSAFDDGSDGIHRANDFGLELWRDVKLDLLEEVFRSTKAAHDKDILLEKQLVQFRGMGCSRRAYLKDSVLGLNGDNLVAD